MAHTDLIAVDDKKLRDLEQGGMPPVVASKTGGIGNPAPLGLLCFGMTTGACSLVACCARALARLSLRNDFASFCHYDCP